MGEIWTAEGELRELMACSSDIEEIAELLTDHGARDAAAETEEVLCIMRHAERRISVRVKRLEGVWDAAYRVDAGKEREGQLEEALANYRVEVEPKVMR